MRVLIADDDRLVGSMLKIFVEQCGHEVVGVVHGGGLEAMKAFAEALPEVVLLDVLMPRCNGFTVCHAVQSRKPDTKVIFMSGSVDAEHPYVTGCRPAGFLQKPMKLDDVKAALDALDGEETIAAEEVAEGDDLVALSV
jgi:DNA-binding response OmpR family regulator